MDELRLFSNEPPQTIFVLISLKLSFHAMLPPIPHSLSLSVFFAPLLISLECKCVAGDRPLFIAVKLTVHEERFGFCQSQSET